MTRRGHQHRNTVVQKGITDEVTVVLLHNGIVEVLKAHIPSDTVTEVRNDEVIGATVNVSLNMDNNLRSRGLITTYSAANTAATAATAPTTATTSVRTSFKVNVPATGIAALTELGNSIADKWEHHSHQRRGTLSNTRNLLELLSMKDFLSLVLAALSKSMRAVTISALKF
ncbi:hypothetical protein [Bifidobacterium moukalabense]|uniref:hypothetical protein n=1 Tax=Bifidobacterium moukalabense TaxID=1333651 RepID=UPI0010F76070|nr:hypothetical protein [Bifidobacterium moukalabense]